MSTSEIAEFQGPFRFLSNFYPATIVFKGHIYRTSEHAYQAQKATTESDRYEIEQVESPAGAKKLSREINIRKDWDSVRLDVMREVLIAKFSQHGDLAKKLIATNPRPIVEDNWWGDTFWGRCKGQGENNLGKLLMEVRSGLLTNGL